MKLDQHHLDAGAVNDNPNPSGYPVAQGLCQITLQMMARVVSCSLN